MVFGGACITIFIWFQVNIHFENYFIHTVFSISNGKQKFHLATSELWFDTVWLLTVGCRVNDKCYVVKPETIDALKDNIREAIGGEIQLHTNDKVLKNWIDRVSYCMASHLNEIIFHYWPEGLYF